MIKSRYGATKYDKNMALGIRSKIAVLFERMPHFIHFFLPSIFLPLERRYFILDPKTPINLAFAFSLNRLVSFVSRNLFNVVCPYTSQPLDNNAIAGRPVTHNLLSIHLTYLKDAMGVMKGRHSL